MAMEIPPEVNDRLATEQNIWLTTTRADGLPLPNTVWFLWRKGEFLVFTVPDSVKMKNMRRNPLVALNFNTSSLDGSDIAIFHAEADVNCAQQSKEEFQAYLTKYKEGLEMLGITREVLLESYRLVRMKPTRFRTVTG
jgi:PPOX class probable F420-dependent enzyme